MVEVLIANHHNHHQNIFLVVILVSPIITKCLSIEKASAHMERHKKIAAKPS